MKLISIAWITLELLISFITCIWCTKRMHWKIALSALTCKNIVYKGGRHTEYPNKEVANGKVKDEEVGYCPHVSVLHNNETNQTVAQHTEQEDEQVRDDEDCGHGSSVLIKRKICHVVLKIKIGSWSIKKEWIVFLSCNILIQFLTHRASALNRKAAVLVTSFIKIQYTHKCITNFNNLSLQGHINA